MPEDAELEAIRQRKIAQMQQQQDAVGAHQQQAQQAQQLENQAKIMVRPFLTQEAWEQWNTALSGNKENALRAAGEIIALGQSGRLPGKLAVPELKKILGLIYRQTHRDISIKRV